MQKFKDTAFAIDNDWIYVNKQSKEVKNRVVLSLSLRFFRF